MIDFVNQEYFRETSIPKAISMTFSGGCTLSTADLFSFELTESLVSDVANVRFGDCVASKLVFTTNDMQLGNLKGQTVVVKMTVNNDALHPLTIGTYRVVDEEKDGSARIKRITCYDMLSEVLNTDFAGWYNSLVFPLKISAFLSSFLYECGLDAEEYTLANGDIRIKKGIEPNKLYGKDILPAILEVNGMFGHMTRDNKLRLITLNPNIHELYPSGDLYPSDDLYPQEPENVTPITDQYITGTYKEYEVQKITKVIVRSDKNAVGVTAGSGSNVYAVEGNFLTYGLDNATLTSLANTLYSKLNNTTTYTPFKATFIGNPCIEVGDGIRYASRNGAVESLVFKRTLKGIQALRDTYEADGDETRTTENGSFASVFKSLEQQALRIDIKSDSLTVDLINTAGKLWDRSGITITREGYGPPAIEPEDESGDIYLDVSNGQTYGFVEDEWVAGDVLPGKTDTIESQLQIMSGRIATKITSSEAYSIAEQTVNSITLSVSDSGGTTTFKLKSGGTTIDTETFDIHCKSMNIDGEITADAINLNTATISGTLKVGNIDVDGLVSSFSSKTLGCDDLIVHSSIRASSLTLGGSYAYWTRLSDLSDSDYVLTHY